jgi:hypothetical protein
VAAWRTEHGTVRIRHRRNWLIRCRPRVRWLRRVCASLRSAGSTGSSGVDMARPIPWMPSPLQGRASRVTPTVSPKLVMATLK